MSQDKLTLVYPEPPHNVPYKNGNDTFWYRNIHEYIYKDEKYEFKIPSGFEYDGASVPRLFWTLSGLHNDGAMRTASLVHDWIYVYEGRLPGRFDKPIRRIEADKLFYKILREQGVSRYRAWIAYKGVRMGGGTFWQDNPRKNKLTFND